MSNPFDNTTWVRMCLKTGAITPPRGSEIERANRLTMYAVFAAVIVGSLISWVAFTWK